MALEDEVKSLTAAVQALTEVLILNAKSRITIGGSDAILKNGECEANPTPKTEKKKPAPKAEEPKLEAPPVDAPEEVPLTYEIVAKEVLKLVMKDRALCEKMLAEHGLTTFKAAKPEQYAAILKDTEGLLNG